jgi:hypothetical protein
MFKSSQCKINEPFITLRNRFISHVDAVFLSIDENNDQISLIHEYLCNMSIESSSLSINFGYKLKSASNGLRGNAGSLISSSSISAALV